MKQKFINFISAFGMFALVLGATWGFMLYCEKCISLVIDAVEGVKGMINATKKEKQIAFDEEPMKIAGDIDDAAQNSEPMTMEELEDLCN